MSRVETPRPLDPQRTITIVSGLPRSGTSMMMQILEAAGLELATDDHRVPDADNPNGYFELDAAKRLRDDSSFLDSVVGRVIKVVTPQLFFLPREYDYRVISMERELDEVLASQRVMLDRKGSAENARADDLALADAYRRQLERVNLWLAGQVSIRHCVVSYHLLLTSTAVAVSVVSAFLEETGAFETIGSASEDGSEARELVETRMAAVVDPDLYHQRGSTGPAELF